ncbi:MAG TPA: methylmalonyl-CoA mutase family protein [Chloroflexota bacterium]|nr:methylmalonyl-CoA mutase family protein [Chloroflexota bacterium]
MIGDKEAAAAGWKARQNGDGAGPEGRPDRFITVSGDEIAPLYTPDSIAGLDYARDLGDPGQFPYTRGIHASMYRGRLWTMRQFAGYGTARETNERFRFLLDQGQTGLSTAFDLPTLMGLDSDDPMSLGEVGHCGVAIDSLDDMETLFSGIPLDRVTTSMTITSPAIILLAMYVAVAERQGVPPEQLGGTLQTDILKEYIAQNEYIFPPRPSMRLVTDIMVYTTRHMPRWHPVSISGYHIREAGSTAAQELAFTLADGMAYVQAAIDAGLEVDDFAPRLSFFFNSHIDFFEEIAKFRAARRIWARIMRDRFGARNPRSWQLRFHTQTAGCSLTAQQPINNITRTALEALSAVLGGTQSLHTNAMDEAMALPTEEAAQIALRTQQVIAYESGVAGTPDPLAGSYFVEALTNRMEEQANRYFERIEEQGGVLACIDNGFFVHEIHDAAREYQRQIETGERIQVGVNRFVDPEEEQIPLLEIDPALEREQVERLRALRARRDASWHAESLQRLENAARGSDNLMYPIIDAVKADATEGEIIDVLAGVFGRYREPAFF